MKSSREAGPRAQGTAAGPSSLLPFSCHKRKKKEEKRVTGCQGQVEKWRSSEENGPEWTFCLFFQRGGGLKF